MKNRLFVAINLPEKIKWNLLEYRERWPDLPIKWTKKDNLHITLVFLGNLKKENLGNICKSIKEEVKNKKPFPIKLTKVCYAPPKKIPPRMIWSVGKKSSKFSSLKNNLENSLTKRISFKPQRKSFIPHITLGRIRKWQWRRIEPGERPKVNEDIFLNFEASSIELMKSILKREGPQYETLQSFPLNK